MNSGAAATSASTASIVSSASGGGDQAIGLLDRHQQRVEARFLDAEAVADEPRYQRPADTGFAFHPHVRRPSRQRFRGATRSAFDRSVLPIFSGLGSARSPSEISSDDDT